MRTIYTEDLKEPAKRLRAAKDWTVLATTKPKPQVLYFQCPRHLGLRLLYIQGKGYICPFCGPTLPATREVIAT